MEMYIIDELYTIRAYAFGHIVQFRAWVGIGGAHGIEVLYDGTFDEDAPQDYINLYDYAAGETALRSYTDFAVAVGEYLNELNEHDADCHAEQ